MTWMSEMRQHENQVFAMEVSLPDPFVTEVFTDTELIAAAARRFGLNAGDSLTLKTGWDFLQPSRREAALSVIAATKPEVVILAFPCGPWSPLHRLNPPPDLAERREAARQLVLFAIEVAELQMNTGRHFMIENPLPSAAWQLEELQAFMNRPDVLSVVVDMCAFNLRAATGELHRKRTRLLTSSQALVSSMMNKKCAGDHEHAPVIGGSKVTEAAGHYSREFSDAVIRAFMEQFDFETGALFQALDEVQAHEVHVADGSAVVPDGSDANFDSDGSFELVTEDEQLVVNSAVKSAVFRLHVNTGHRSPTRLARALLLCGAPKEAVMAARRLKCAVCQERRQPRARLPASLPPPREVGQQVHVDLVVVEDSLRQSHVVAHATDAVSRFQQLQ